MKRKKRKCCKECQEPALARGLCRRHYDQWRRTDPAQVEKFNAANRRYSARKEAYAEAQARIAELEARSLRVRLPDPSCKAFWTVYGEKETFLPCAYKRWIKESIEHAGIIAKVPVKVG